MNERQLRIQDDLRDLVTGEILTGDLERAAYSVDASILQVRPLAIVAPRTIKELCDTVQYARDMGLSLHARGAGTGLAGESLGSGVVIDTSRFLNQILQTGHNTVRVQPGVRWLDLQRHLAPQGRMFAPDPMSGNRCTLGGMLATDAAGPHSLRYGTTRDHVLGLRVVLATGELVELGREAIPTAPTRAEEEDKPSALPTILRDVARTLEQAESAIQAEQRGDLPKPGGYYLRGVLQQNTLDMPRLLVGSEGSLVIFAEAVLATLPVPAFRGVLLTCFASLHLAASAVVESLEFQPTACEMLDRRLLSVIRDADPRYRAWIPEDAEAALFIEQESNDLGNLRHRLRQMGDHLRRHKRLALTAVEIVGEEELNLCWEMREQATATLGRGRGTAQPVPFVENTAVPPAALPRFLQQVQQIMRRHGVTASYMAHAGVGVLHARPLLDLGLPEDRAKLPAIADEMLDAALALGGTCNAEHGAGLLRSGLMPRQFPALYPVFTAIKNAFDPLNLLNPGKIVGADTTFPLAYLRDPLREVLSSSGTHETPLPVAPTLLRWPEMTVLETASRCNGCGSCRTGLPEVRMCPTFKVLGSELATPRAKATLMRQLLAGELDPRYLPSDTFRKVADLCVNCKMCRVECPSGVDMARLMLEAKATNVAEQGLNRTDWFLAGLERWARWGSTYASLLNPLLRSPTARWIAEQLWGLSARGRLPAFARRTFLQQAAKRGWTKKPLPRERRPKVALMVDLFLNHFDPIAGECAVQVLEKQGLRVYVPPLQRPSGMIPLQLGDLDGARACVRHNLEIFAELAREGFDIVCPEPAAALMWRDDAAYLVDDPDLPLLAQRTFEFSEYLGHLSNEGRLANGLTSIPLAIGYHEPCHYRALPPRAGVVELMTRIPQLKFVTLELGCSGMAGVWGLRADAVTTSLAAGRPLRDRLARHDLHAGMTQCSACRLQMETGTHKPTLHPAKWLALAYGLTDARTAGLPYGNA